MWDDKSIAKLAALLAVRIRAIFGGGVCMADATGMGKLSA